MKPNKLFFDLNRGRIILGVITFWVALLSGIGAAHAHKVSIFAWVEGDTVHTESKFSGGKKVKNSSIEVYDTLGNQILVGKTDENGEFSFKIPKKTGIKLVLLAGMGHRAEWTIPLEEIESVAAARTEPLASQETVTKKSKMPEEELSGSEPGSMKIRTTLEKSLDKKLDLIIKKLDKMQGRGPGLKDILGAIGYIFGLVGVATYFNYRKK